MILLITLEAITQGAVPITAVKPIQKRTMYLLWCFHRERETMLFKRTVPIADSSSFESAASAGKTTRSKLPSPVDNTICSSTSSVSGVIASIASFPDSEPFF